MLYSLLQNSYFSVFLIIALGYMLGRIKIKGVSLDVSAVIFIALLFGHFGVTIPSSLGYFGLVLFIFTIGLQSGPGFFDSFQKNGKKLLMMALIIVVSAGTVGLGLGHLFGIDMPGVTGLIAGALTSTPGLAVAIDSTNSPLASIAYGIAYPFGVIGVILFVKFFPKIIGVDMQEEALRLERQEKAAYPEVNFAVFRVKNPTVFGKSLSELQIRTMTGSVISRLIHDGVMVIPRARTVLREGDLVKAVGTDNSLNQLALFIGERTEIELPVDHDQVVESLLVTNKRMVDRTLGALDLSRAYHCNITRIRRSGVVLSPTPDLKLKFGDKVVVVGERRSVQEVGLLLGNNEKKLSDTDFFPIAMGIVLGILVGQLQISFSNSFTFSLGLTGGVLITALVLSKLGKTGPILWSMSGMSNQLLRQLGLLLFLAEVGTSAGANLFATFQTYGLPYFLAGAAITIVPMIIAGLLGFYLLKIPILDLMGTIVGGMTSTPGLATVDSMTDSTAPSVAYATVYPVAMVLLIVLIQVLALFP
ncbi:MAG: transporter [Bacteroidia bacterium 44-10]|nr:MAG: transporter [Bacteroidia bacterium 44-10]